MASNLFWLSAALFCVVSIVGFLAVSDLSSEVDTLKLQVSDLKTQITTNRTATYESRSVGCRLLVGHGIKFPDNDPCNDPRVLRYYDPEAIAPAATSVDALKNRAIDCQQLRILGGSDPACQGL